MEERQACGRQIEAQPYDLNKTPPWFCSACAVPGRRDEGVEGDSLEGLAGVLLHLAWRTGFSER